MSEQTYLTEEDTKLRYITPAIKNAGWKPDQILMEYSLKADRYRILPGQNEAIKEPGRRSNPDYVLCKSINCPLAVVEAKRQGVDPATAAAQAQAYADMLDVPFVYASSGTNFYEYEKPWGQPKILKLDDFPSPDELWNRWLKQYKISDAAQESLNHAVYHSSAEGIQPRYYQLQAINRTVNAIIVNKRKRILLVMATGTGKTYTAFQIVWRLKSAGVVKNVLYLADRNQLVDQTMVSDFAPFNKITTKITGRKLSKSYEIYFGLYQQLKGEQSESTANLYKRIPSDYFDLIIVDECHRGSAREQSSWRDILTHFSTAIQIGMTATPNEKDGSNNLDYFGEPLLTYSLKQGIEDGFLAPFRVVSVTMDKDITGWEPKEGEKDLEGKEIPKRLYTQADFDTTLELRSRTDRVAEVVTRYLHHIGRMSKTIIFCNTQRHAATMRDFIREHNKDIVAQESNYAVRMTSDDNDGKDLYDAFISVNRDYPVVVTTSKLLTTGANTKCVKLIVLDSKIKSMTEFKQIIGRGTRLRPDAGKTFFTILDFRGVCRLFSDPEFDGDAEEVTDWSDQDDPPGSDGPLATTPGKKKGKSHGRRDVYVVEGEPVSVAHEATQLIGEGGNLITEKFIDYTRRNLLGVYNSDDEFVTVWNNAQTKTEILEGLSERGVSFRQMQEELGDPNLDEFDMIRHIAFGQPLFTRQARATRARKKKFLDKYQGVVREVLDKLLDTYSLHGVREIEDLRALKTYCSGIGGFKKLVKAFGGREAVLSAVRDMEQVLYSEAS